MIGRSSCICLVSFLWPSYANLSQKVEDLIMYRLLLDEGGNRVDGVGGGIEEILETGADGEEYLPRIYLSLRSQGMVSANDCVLPGYFGCRQQCLYGCICFCLLLIGMYHGDRLNMPCIDWINHVVLDGGCGRLGDEFVEGMGLFQRALLNSICEMACCKPIVNCVFDLVNTKNPSGGMVGPGNCQWFHNLLLLMMGGVSENFQKVLKNHAAIHDACGFMLTHMDIGPRQLYKDQGIHEKLKKRVCNHVLAMLTTYMETRLWDQINWLLSSVVQVYGSKCQKATFSVFTWSEFWN